jgi:hypothetical protein
MFWFGGGKGKESVIIYSRKTGKKLCEVRTPQKWWSGLPLPIPYVWISYHTVWKDPEAIKRWAWLQSYVIVQSIREPALISKQTRCECLVCGEGSVTPVYGRLWAKNTVIGFRCLNKHCGMFKVRLPAILTSNLLAMPEDLLMECMTRTGQTTIWTPKGKGLYDME